LAVYCFSPLFVFGMIVVDFFSEACCKGTELVEGWYWHEDDGDAVGGPYENEEKAVEAANNGKGW
jgi:hypothetical protein